MPSPHDGQGATAAGEKPKKPKRLKALWIAIPVAGEGLPPNTVELVRVDGGKTAARKLLAARKIDVLSIDKITIIRGDKLDLKIGTQVVLKF